MPWTTDGNGERVYKVSLYAKEELPTWNEIYEWLKTPRALMYSPDTEEGKVMDPYWKVPAVKYRLATVCNQFNKMLFEDGMEQKLIDYFNNLPNGLAGTVSDIRFILEPINLEWLKTARTLDKDSISEAYTKHQNDMIHKFSVGDPNTPPPIYTIPLPTGENNPFITNDFPRTNINDINEYPLIVTPVMKVDLPDLDTHKGVFYLYIPDLTLPPELIDKDTVIKYYSTIISLMVKEVKSYFENGVGWKDENGDLIEKAPPTTSCQGVGVDPAL